MRYNLYSINYIFKAYNLISLKYVYTSETITRIKIMDITIILKSFLMLTVIHPSLPISTLFFFYQTTTDLLTVTIDYDVEELEFSYTVDGNVKWYTYFGKVFGSFFKNETYSYNVTYTLCS